MRTSPVVAGTEPEGRPPESRHPYRGRTSVLATMHDKLPLIAPAMLTTMGLQVVGVAVDTDHLGTVTANVTSGDDIDALLQRGGFPEHGVIVRPDAGRPAPLHKGVHDRAVLDEAIRTCAALSSDGHVHLETDLRAHHCPSRRPIIAAAAYRLVERLATRCPTCATPGWGIVRVELGVPCQLCGRPVQVPNADVYGCAACRGRTDVLADADGAGGEDVAELGDQRLDVALADVGDRAVAELVDRVPLRRNSLVRSAPFACSRHTAWYTVVETVVPSWRSRIFQAQYLRRIRVPEPKAISRRDQTALRSAFGARDRGAASAIARRLYGIDEPIGRR